MIRNLFELYKQFSSKNRLHLFLLQLLVIFSSILEVISILSIAPFMYLMIDPANIVNNVYFAKLFSFINIRELNDMLLITGLATLSMFSISTASSIYTQNKFIFFSFNVGAEIGNKLFKYYLNKDWLFFTQGNSNNYLRKISQEAERVSTGVIQQALMMNSRIILSIILIFTIFLYNNFVALFLFLIFALSYLIIFNFLKKRIIFHGENISVKQNDRFRIMSESFGGIKDIILNQSDNYFINKFEKASFNHAKSKGSNVIFSMLPRYLLELIFYGTIIILCIILLLIQESNTTSILITLSVFGLASLKLLPTFQSIYFCYSNIAGNISAYYEIRKELNEIIEKNKIKKSFVYKKIPNTFKNINLIDVCFKYPNSKKNTLNNINITIPFMSKIGIVGMTGSGKSTLIDIICGLISPTKGEIKIDNHYLNQETINSWYERIGLANQSIFIADKKLVENIAFGIDEKYIDINKIEAAIKASYLNEFTEKLPDKKNTILGERGVQLSGGQRQRIAIARAFYFNKDILILDEATSSIDNFTEEKIISNIFNISKNKTLIMISHKINTLKDCDKIYVISEGNIIDEGKFEDLIINSEEFKKIAKINNN
tara:strand:- start:105 stop:1910 length:1806 start_codon:yes stop_codon:yes gene_type:complete